MASTKNEKGLDDSLTLALASLRRYSREVLLREQFPVDYAASPDWQAKLERQLAGTTRALAQYADSLESNKDWSFGSSAACILQEANLCIMLTTAAEEIQKHCSMLEAARREASWMYDLQRLQQHHPEPSSFMGRDAQLEGLDSFPIGFETGAPGVGGVSLNNGAPVARVTQVVDAPSVPRLQDEAGTITELSWPFPPEIPSDSHCEQSIACQSPLSDAEPSEQDQPRPAQDDGNDSVGAYQDSDEANTGPEQQLHTRHVPDAYLCRFCNDPGPFKNLSDVNKHELTHVHAGLVLSGT